MRPCCDRKLINNKGFLSKYSINASLAEDSLNAVEVGQQFTIQIEIFLLKKEDDLEDNLYIFLRTDITGKAQWLPFNYIEDNLWELRLTPDSPGLFKLAIYFFEGRGNNILLSTPSFKITGWLRVDPDGIDVIKTVFVREYGKKNPKSGITYSGTFNDLLPHLKSFKEKNIDALILLPIHPLGKALWGSVGSPYEPMDFFSIEPSLIKPKWKAGTRLLQSEFKDYLNSSSTYELQAFSDFKKEKKINEYARYNAARLLADRLNVPIKDILTYQNDPAFISLVEQTCYEQFVARKSFQHLINSAHSIGLKIFMDIPGYFGSDSIAEYFYEPWVLKNPDGNYYQPGSKQWGNGWYTLRQLDINKAGVLKYLCSIYSYWKDTCHVDGFRIDAILTQPDQYIRKIRKEVKSAFLIGETIGVYEGNKEKRYFDDIKLNSIYDSDWIWTTDINGYLNAAHERSSEKRMLHMRDTHDEGRLKSRDYFAYPKERYLGVLAAGILGFPGKDIVGLLDGNFDLLGGIPKLHEISLKESTNVDNTKIFTSNGMAISSKDYLTKILGLRKTISVFKENNNFVSLEQKQSDICSYIRIGKKYDVLVLANLGNNECQGIINLPQEKYVPSDLIDLFTGLKTGFKCNEKGTIDLNIGQTCVFVLSKRYLKENKSGSIATYDSQYRIQEIFYPDGSRVIFEKDGSIKILYGPGVVRLKALQATLPNESRVTFAQRRNKRYAFILTVVLPDGQTLSSFYDINGNPC